ncbi:unnamed protein product [Sympodiomycopsis kandeliae]
MSYNAPDFDLSAFINSPLPQQDSTLMPLGTETIPADQVGAMTQDVYTQTRNATVKSALAGATQSIDTGLNTTGDQSNATVNPPSRQVYTGWDDYDQSQMSAPAVPTNTVASTKFMDTTFNSTVDNVNSTMDNVATADSQPDHRALAYSARVAAHHSEKLRAVLPAGVILPGPTGGSLGGLGASLGLPGQRSMGGSVSSSAVPVSYTARRAAAATTPILTLQERRRNTRRAQAKAKAARQSISHHAQSPIKGTVDSGVSHSGRFAKRGMAAGTGRIQSPESTDAARQQQSQAIASKADGYARSQSGADVFQNEPREQNDTVESSASEINSQADIKTGPHGQSSASVIPAQAYSASGFDMIGALARVVLRPNPRISLGPVDMSASFTVCDARHPDQPIVYCSDTFCKLTGYSRAEIIGRNCRFLQSPDGRVHQGAQRYHTDNAAVAHLRQHSRSMQECQASLVNYRKNGSPFINLVTVVPISWDNSSNTAYLVGFQVDLVEQPNAVLERAADGSYVVNYSTGDGTSARLAVPELAPPAPRDIEQENAQREVAIGKDIVDIMSGGKEDTSQWARIMLQHSQDLIHVLSLKGTFLYVSPSVERLLGFKPEELIGKSVSDFCHPSDVVPVFRELKDSTSNASINAAAKRSFRSDGTSNRATKGGVGQGGPEVNLLMRMKRKDGSHVWIESKGKLHLEQGKGRKVVISSGRTRPVYNLPWAPVKEAVGADHPSFWAKVSTDGLVLSATDGVSTVIDGVDAASLYGRHLQQMVNNEALPALLGGLRGMQVTTVTHKMWNIVDDPVWVTSTLYPSAVVPGAHTVPVVFAKISLTQLEGMPKINVAEVRPPKKSVPLEPELEQGAIPMSSVFGELSTTRSSSHIYELHSLKHANRRLKDDVRAAQRRLGNKAGVRPWADAASHVSQPTAPLKEGYVEALNRKGGNANLLAPPVRSSSSSTPSANGGLSSGSGEPPSIFDSGNNSGSNSGNASDDTRATTAVSSGNASDSSGSENKKSV